MCISKCKRGILMEKLSVTELQHVSPESVGINSSAIKAFIDEINEKKLGLQSFTVVRNDKVCAQGFLNHMQRSILMYSIQ